MSSRQCDTKRHRPMTSFGLMFLASLVTTTQAFIPYSDSFFHVSVRSHSSLSKATRTTRHQSSTLAAASKDTKGVYSRPSAAIEKGSGFFIPGLEGPRVRLLFGLVVLLLTVVNHVMLSSSSSLQTTVAFPERLAVVYAILLLLQAAIEFGKEEKGYVVTLEDDSATDEQQQDSSSSSYSQSWSSSASSLSQEERERVEWSAASYLSLTPAIQLLLLDRNDGVLYRLGSTPTTQRATDLSKDDEMTGVEAAFGAAENTTSGRVSLPSTHPAVVALDLQEESCRCVVLQRIDESKCWMMTSNQLLQAFTKEDLKWLGQLAKHVVIK